MPFETELFIDAADLAHTTNLSQRSENLSKLSVDARLLLLKCLSVTPHERPTADEAPRIVSKMLKWA